MSISCGVDSTIVVDENGSVFSFGFNSRGELGSGQGQDFLRPNHVVGLPSPVRQVANADRHTGMVTKTGDLLMCGLGRLGRLGLGDENDRTTPTRVDRAAFDGEAVLMVACAVDHTVVATEGGGVYTFGSGRDGQLGHGDEEQQLAPRRVPAAAFNGERIVMVAAGSGFGGHTMALSEAGHVFTWGSGESGQLGHGDFNNSRSPRQVEPGRFGGDAPEPVVFVAAGAEHSAAVTAAGRLYTWGYNGDGQLGHGDTQIRMVPTMVMPVVFNGLSVVMATCNMEHMLVATEDGALWACGEGRDGQLGLNDKRNNLFFKQVRKGTGESFGSARVVMAAAGSMHSAAVTEDGKLWTWGANQHGQLGHGDKRPWHAPKLVSLSTRIGLFHDLPRAHVLAFAMGAHDRLGTGSSIRMVSGENGLLTMIAQFANTALTNLPERVKRCTGLMRLLGFVGNRYQMQMTPPPPPAQPEPM